MRTNRLGRTLASLLAPLALAGCATIFTGTSDTLRFESNVPGVRLTIDGQYLGELPLTVDMSRNFMGGRQFLARFEREGYVTQEFQLQRQFNAVAILDVTSIPTSGGIDVLTGSLLRFSPKDYHVQMLSEGGAATSAEFRRSTAVHAFALVNHRAIQRDLARGGGESLAGLAAVLCGGDEASAALVTAESLRNAERLVAAPTAHAFVARLDLMLSESPALRPLRM